MHQDRCCLPRGETAQGPLPSLVDYSMVVEANFPIDLVLMMKENAAKKVRRTVIGMTLGGKATLKSLLDCFKLPLLIPLVSITLLTRGYFEILFEEEEGAKATRRLTAIEWSGLCFSFSCYAPNFDASSQGAEAQLTHAIKVQFPDLHDEFRNTRALTIMASKLGEVLEIKVADLYIKRPVGPMITIELRDISKFPRYIRIPSMVEGTEDNVTITQRILYSGLPNQCRRCRRFGHHARTCTTSRSKPWEGAPTPNPPNTRGEEGKRPGGVGVPQPSKAQANKQPQAQNAKRNQVQTEMNQRQPEASKQAGHLTQQNIVNTSDALLNTEATPRNLIQKDTPGNLETNQVDSFSSDIPSAATTNPFAALEKLNPEAEDLRYTQGESSESWAFQASRKQAPRDASPRQALPHSPTHVPTQDFTPGSRRKRTCSEVHNSFFTSLGIPVPPGQEHARARVWPVLSRERDNQKEILVNVKSNDSPNLPLHIRCMSASEKEWTSASALEDLTRNVEIELEEKILRFSLSLKGRLALEWSWQEDHAKGGWECTILAHISTGFSGISAQKRKNLHWRTLESMPNMNNDVVFVGPAHSLLLKTGLASTDRQTRKSVSASLLASRQAARKKKRYIKLDLLTLVPSNSSGLF
ncbi:unnamed protein product [Sphagnum balticum]